MADKENNQTQAHRIPKRTPKRIPRQPQPQARRRCGRQGLRRAPDAAAQPLRAPLLAAGRHRLARRLAQIAVRRCRALLVMVAVDRYLAPEASDQRSLQRRRSLGRHQQPSRARASLRPPSQGITRLAAIYLAHAGLGVPLPVRPGLPDAVDRPENHVRSAPRHLPPHAAHGRRILRRSSRRPPRHAPHLRRRRHQRHVYRRRAGHRQ